MRFGIRIGCLILLASSVGSFSASTPGRRVLGVVIQTEQGKLDSADAKVGSNVYSCDRLETPDSGILRVRVGASQMFLTKTSLAELEDESNAIQGIAMNGTVGFASPAGDSFSLRTPAGIVRAANGLAVTGQVVFTGPQKLLISAIHGDLILDAGGELRTIPEGQSAEVTFDNNMDNSCHEGAYADESQAKTPAIHRPVGFYLVAGGAAAVGAYWGWHESSESPSKPDR